MQFFFFGKYIPILSSLLLLLNSCLQRQESTETSPPDHHARSTMFNTPSHPHPNALIQESSPYLLQHAHNPVDWRPWSEEAWDIRAVYFFFMRRTYNQLEGRVKEHPVYASSI